MSSSDVEDVSSTETTQIASKNEETILENPEFAVILTTLCILGVLFVIGIGSNTILLWAFYRRPKLQSISNR